MHHFRMVYEYVIMLYGRKWSMYSDHYSVSWNKHIHIHGAIHGENIINGQETSKEERLPMLQDHSSPKNTTKPPRRTGKWAVLRNHQMKPIMARRCQMAVWIRLQSRAAGIKHSDPRVHYTLLHSNSENNSWHWPGVSVLHGEFVCVSMEYGTWDQNLIKSQKWGEWNDIM